MERRSGRTTRGIDRRIQQLFQDGKTVVVDHHRTTDANKHMLNILLRRLKAEHEMDYSSFTVREDYSEHVGMSFIVTVNNYP